MHCSDSSFSSAPTVLTHSKIIKIKIFFHKKATNLTQFFPFPLLLFFAPLKLPKPKSKSTPQTLLSCFGINTERERERLSNGNAEGVVSSMLQSVSSSYGMPGEEEETVRTGPRRFNSLFWHCFGPPHNPTCTPSSWSLRITSLFAAFSHTPWWLCASLSLTPSSYSSCSSSLKLVLSFSFFTPLIDLLHGLNFPQFFFIIYFFMILHDHELVFLPFYSVLN